MSKRNPKRRSSESPLSVQFRSCKDLNQLGACDTMASPFDHDIQSSNWDVVPVPALQDNYMYLVIDRSTKKAVGVDGVEPHKLLEEAKKQGCEIDLLLTTHSHWDHDGGNEEFAKLRPGVPIVGGKGDGVQAATKEVTEDDVLEVGNLKISVLETPFHTKAHVCYNVHHEQDEGGEKAVFTGDTLFVGGCGNLNRGTKDQLHSAFKKLGELPTETLCYVGHEYTNANLAYAKSVEPSNSKLLAKEEWAHAKRAKGLFTVPSTIAEEHEISPFMRAAFGKSAEVEKLSKTSNPVENILFVRRDKSSNAWKQRL